MRALLILLIALWPSLAWGKRVALVVGVSDYEHLQTLETPVRDARAFAAAIAGHGFAAADVTLLIDPDMGRIAEAVAAFTESLEETDEALFFFSGHGAQRDGDNYLFARDSRVRATDSRFRLERESLNVTLLLDEMQRRAQVSLLFLDACRTELPGSKSIGAAKGFSFVNVSETMTEGAFVGFAAQENTPSFTGEGELSFYTAALVETLEEPSYAGDIVQRLHDEAARRTREATDGQQSPSYRNLLRQGSFRFAAEQTEEPEPPAPEPTPTPQPTPTADPCAGPNRDWSYVEADGADCPALSAYIAVHEGSACYRAQYAVRLHARSCAAPQPTPTPQPLPPAPVSYDIPEPPKLRPYRAPPPPPPPVYQPEPEPPTYTPPPPPTAYVPTERTSFDCNRASHVDEKIICTHADAAAADIRMARVYAEMRARMSQEQARRLRLNQRRWLRARRERFCPATGTFEAMTRAQRALMAGCLAREMRERVSDLQRWR